MKPDQIVQWIQLKASTLLRKSSSIHFRNLCAICRLWFNRIVSCDAPWTGKKPDLDAFFANENVLWFCFSSSIGVELCHDCQAAHVTVVANPFLISIDLFLLALHRRTNTKWNWLAGVVKDWRLYAASHRLPQRALRCGSVFTQAMPCGRRTVWIRHLWWWNDRKWWVLLRIELKIFTFSNWKLSKYPLNRSELV